MVMELAVANDAAERGMKDVQDCASAAREEERRGRTVTVVISHRAAAPTLTNQELENLRGSVKRDA